jgi:predicted Zn-dependent protease
MCQGKTITRRNLLRYAGAASLPLVSGCDVPVDLVSDEEVEAMGLQAWEEIRASSPVASSPELQSVLDRVSARLLSASGQSPADWEILVFARPEINAFALPGKKIGVFEGMFRVIGSEDQLAAIVGHEIGHLQAEHGQERMNAQLSADWGMSILAYLLRIGGVEYAAEIAAAMGLGVEYGLVLPYSRQQELEADRLGLVTMATAGYAPEQAVDLWRRMDVAAGARPPEFLATHPAPASRIEAIEAMLPEIRRL